MQQLNLICDSGMFSAWKRGVEIDPDAYVDFVQRNEKYLFACVSLDAIPGGTVKSLYVGEQEIAGCAKLSYKNHQYLKHAGLQPIPVFHQFDPFEWLDRYIEDGETYIGISPYLRAHKSAIRTWLDKCFLRLTNKNGLPIVQTHGFGMTTIELLVRYPWYSVDSTSWVMTGAYGCVAIPLRRGDGSYDYTRPLRVTLTNRPNSRPNDFDLQLLIQPSVREYFSTIGLDLELLRNSDKERYKAALIFNRELARQIGRVRFNPGSRDHAQRRATAIDIPTVRIFAATTPAHPKSEALNEVGVEDRLLSFWDIRDQPADFIARYFETGLPLTQRRHNRQTGDQHRRYVEKVRSAQ